MSNKSVNKQHSLIAISGMPGAGKTSVSEQLISTIPNLTYFDFGAFFRPLTYYLIKEKKLSIEQLQQIVETGRIDELMEKLNVGYRNNNKEYEFSVRNKFYKSEELYNPEMNKTTVDVGTCFGDSLNPHIHSIITNIRQANPVLLNARRPFSVCSDISNHIFLKADFHERAKRKAVLEHTTLEEAVNRLRKRDEKEYRAGFWTTYPFTKIIDTTHLETEQTTELVKQHILQYTIPTSDVPNNNNIQQPEM